MLLLRTTALQHQAGAFPGSEKVGAPRWPSSVGDPTASCPAAPSRAVCSRLTQLDQTISPLPAFAPAPPSGKLPHPRLCPPHPHMMHYRKRVGSDTEPSLNLVLGSSKDLRQEATSVSLGSHLCNRATLPHRLAVRIPGGDGSAWCPIDVSWIQPPYPPPAALPSLCSLPDHKLLDERNCPLIHIQIPSLQNPEPRWNV